MNGAMKLTARMSRPDHSLAVPSSAYQTHRRPELPGSSKNLLAALSENENPPTLPPVWISLPSTWRIRLAAVPAERAIERPDADNWPPLIVSAATDDAVSVDADTWPPSVVSAFSAVICADDAVSVPAPSAALRSLGTSTRAVLPSTVSAVSGPPAPGTVTAR